ncbi:M20 family metallopeptidase [Actinoplanes subglobosus]|uniref:M20 family metallopeptidase n=1 Tax=Actinoplanes subglobosus TaxID=1547892 RepID=A0ABV8J7C0_9ACTN
MNVETMLEDLKALVEVESPSGDLDAVSASAKTVAAIIENRMGGHATLIDSAAGPHVHWTGGGQPKVLLLGHHDTVFPLGTLARRPFNVQDGRVTGPGVFDMLTGLVQAVHAVASLEDRSGVEILMTADEETGSSTSRALIEERARACGAALVFEGAAEGGALKTGRKGCGTFIVTVTGKAAHAGLEPETGINALVEAAHLVLDIAELNRPEAGTTVTPTLVTAGTMDNVVPAKATISADVRVASAAEQQRVQAAFAALTPHLPGARITVHGSIERPPLTEAMSASLFAIAQQLLPGLEGTSVGGGSDGNFTGALGIPTLDGLGAVGGGAHADHEYALTQPMTERATLAAGLVRALQYGSQSAPV